MQRSLVILHSYSCFELSCWLHSINIIQYKMLTFKDQRISCTSAEVNEYRIFVVLDSILIKVNVGSNGAQSTNSRFWQLSLLFSAILYFAICHINVEQANDMNVLHIRSAIVLSFKTYQTVFRNATFAQKEKEITRDGIHTTHTRTQHTYASDLDLATNFFATLS